MPVTKTAEPSDKDKTVEEKIEADVTDKKEVEKVKDAKADAEVKK